LCNINTEWEITSRSARYQSMSVWVGWLVICISGFVHAAPIHTIVQWESRWWCSSKFRVTKHQKLSRGNWFVPGQLANC